MHEGDVHGQCAGQIFGGDQPRDQRLARGTVKGIRSCGERGQQINEPDRIALKVRGQRQHQGNGGHHCLSTELQSLSIVSISQHSAPSRKKDDRDHAYQSYGAECKRRAGQHVNVPVDADVLHLRANDGDQRGSP